MSPRESRLDGLALRQWRLERGLRRIGVRARARRSIGRVLARTAGASERRALAQLIGTTLGEPERESRALAADWLYYRVAARGAWLGADSAACEIGDADALGEYFASPRGVVIASIHMGDYLQGLAALAGILQGKRLVILRRQQESERERAAFARLERAGLCVEVVRHGSGAAFAALRALRRASVLVVLYDLPERWGRVQCVRLFGRPAWLVCGPVSLAHAAGAEILPMVTRFDEQGVLRVDTAGVLRPGVDQSAGRSLERLAELAESWIRRAPAQWNHWPLLPAMFRDPGAGGD